MVVSLLFCLQLYFVYNSAVALNFLTGYVIEESLSLDNLFVILLTFESFGIEKAEFELLPLQGLDGAPCGPPSITAPPLLRPSRRVLASSRSAPRDRGAARTHRRLQRGMGPCALSSSL